MSWRDPCEPLFIAKLVVVCMLLSRAAVAEDFSFEKADSNFRFAEIAVAEGLPEGANEADLKSKTEEASKFLWFLYGDASSRAVCLRFDSANPNLLFVDTNRSQKFSANESFESEDDGIWFIELTGEFGPMQKSTDKQTIRIRHDKDSSKWFLATAGTRVGKANFGDQPRIARIEDKNANGRWFDPADRLFVDFDGNEKLSRLREQIPAQGMRKIRGKVWAIAGSPVGKTVSISEVTGSGHIIPTLTLADPSAKITSVSGQFGSSSGVGIPITSVDEPVEVPLGDWYVDNIRFEVTGENGVFMFAFTRSTGGKTVTIADSDRKELELLGELKLTASVSVQRGNETQMTITPMIETDCGCYMIGSQTGKGSANNENRLNCYSGTPDKELEVGSSGFS